ncbi:unnamed protein product [Diatraea saccharalis]|uniref:K Homology domain-containing protein n=1 Tax=Diatraea saccharalis TaxID=40085 RepID=A0A9N9WFC1_9NEOP|nr:unnamed protein product [Diatraea saccharalis]
MASSNFLTVKTHLSEFKNNSDKDTLSEASESGTSNSVTSAEELQKLALILGLNSAEDVYQERFRVDRRRLEAMLAENLEESQTAQAFFHRVMNETNTLINWPARLKIGARSKKDPHVRVAGRPDDVKLAREKIMQLLDTRSNRVTMKIDVSYTDHSHIIGKGGLTIKRVMEETGCHIHFPDSNRTSTVEKSNQVSIAGDMERVERARARVRSQTQVQMSLEISPMHHAVVMGRGAEQLKVIMKGTGTQIMFPDADDPNIPALKKSCVTITGQIKDVYAARQQLVGSLPLVVIFDVSEDSCRIEAEAATKLMQKHNVYINIRRKPKQGIASVVIKGIERCAGGSPVCGGTSYPLSPPVFPAWLVPSPQHNQPFTYPTQHYKHQPAVWNPISNNAEMNMQQPMLMPQYQQMPDNRPTSLSQLLNSSSQASSGYQSNFTGSSVSLDTQNISEITDLANIISDLPLSERRAVGCEKKTLETLNKLSPLSDYRKMKAEANKVCVTCAGHEGECRQRMEGPHPPMGRTLLQPHLARAPHAAQPPATRGHSHGQIFIYYIYTM